MKYFVFLCVLVIGANAFCDEDDNVEVVCEACTEGMTCSLEGIELICSRDPCHNCSVVWTTADGEDYTDQCALTDDVDDVDVDIDGDVDIDNDVDVDDDTDIDVDEDEEGPMSRGDRKWRRKHGRHNRKGKGKFGGKGKSGGQQWRKQIKTMTPEERQAAIQARRESMLARWLAKGKEEKADKIQRKWEAKDERRAGRMERIKGREERKEHFWAMTPEERQAFFEERRAERMQRKENKRNKKGQRGQRRRDRIHANMMRKEERRAQKIARWEAKGKNDKVARFQERWAARAELWEQNAELRKEMLNDIEMKPEKKKAYWDEKRAQKMKRKENKLARKENKRQQKMDKKLYARKGKKLPRWSLWAERAEMNAQVKTESYTAMTVEGGATTSQP